MNSRLRATHFVKCSNVCEFLREKSIKILLLSQQNGIIVDIHLGEIEYFYSAKRPM